MSHSFPTRRSSDLYSSRNTEYVSKGTTNEEFSLSKCGESSSSSNDNRLLLVFGFGSTRSDMTEKKC